MSTEEQIYSYRVTRKVRTGGSRILCILGILLGLVFLIFIFWPVGLALMLISALIDAKTRLISSCGHCGNEVAHTSRLCPTCQADLAPEPRKGWFH
ncbi:MAG TPA: hypothetical protein DDZ88_22005 [Verrucomicrobiales bacterium]|nr:hypothetical protein [Verrucomicrobiales bacterium]